MRTTLSLACLLASSVALPSCEKKTCGDGLVSGVILGGTCIDGTVIEVDPQYPIGRPVRLSVSATDSAVGRNAIATGTNPGNFFVRGQRIYFRTNANYTAPGGMCPTIPPLNVPHVGLEDVSTQACEIE